MKPADLNIYCWIIDAACSRSPERDPELSRGVLCSLRECKVLCSLPPGGASKWLSLAPNFPLHRVKCCLNASCRQADAEPLFPGRSGKEIGENPISTCFGSSVRFIFHGCNVVRLEKYFKFENTLCFAFLLCKMGQAMWSGETWLVTSPSHCFITLVMSNSISVSKLWWLLMATGQCKITLFITIKPCPLQHRPDGRALAALLPADKDAEI